MGNDTYLSRSGDFVASVSYTDGSEIAYGLDGVYVKLQMR